ncbi:TraB/GumN family protein [Vibrio neptunius]|uniref:TraB/GumN family protein n=1 Tax=Vibrio neptunius TaxID=170651 RepID=UPI0019D2906C|nr:TraB/GumN family protein [Vibrio neptunius]MBN3575707.1 TraB/GumN family protein [Vibrio neptunius]QXX06331.1 TraB/GumN family protein [Vibrio neptunius]
MYKFCLLFLTLIVSISAIAEPLYWQAQKGKLNYLILGSVHVGDESMYPLPQTVTQRLKSSDGLIIETDIRKTQGVSYPPVSLLTKDVLSSAQKNELIGMANLLNMDPQQLMLSPPWATALTLQMKQLEYLGYQVTQGIDTHLMNKATIQNIPVISLESLQFQIDLLTGQKEAGKELLVSAIEEFDHSEDATHCLIESWKAGDLDKLKEFANLTEMSPELEQSFLTQRNINWAKQLSEPSWSPKRKGSYVMVVGTLHLVGEQSVLNLLKDSGFKISQLSQSKAANCEFEY